MTTDEEFLGQLQADGSIHPVRLLLASTSSYRAQTLRSMGLPFSQLSPEVDETPLAGEVPDALAVRLAIAKAAGVTPVSYPTVVIGSDQTGDCDGELLSKPGSKAAAVEMLERLQGCTVMFHSALATVYWDTSGQPAAPMHRVVSTQVRFRHLSRDQLSRYVDIDDPQDCAGGFKVERLGIALFEQVTSDDPTALVGLPAIALVQLLQAYGVDPIPVRR